MTAWLAGAITATCAGYFAMARLALPDLPLTFFITLAIWSALERRWLLAGAAAGLGLLMKGPIALVVPGLVLVPIWWRERHRVRCRAADLVARGGRLRGDRATVVRGDDASSTVRRTSRASLSATIWSDLPPIASTSRAPSGSTCRSSSAG